MIGRKIKDLRVLKGLTQEDLADRTKLSVRTIQRIEKGEVDPRTYTLNLLAEALEVDLETFTSEILSQESNEKDKMDVYSKLALLHLSGLFILILPPIFIWIWKKDDLKEYEQHFKDVMNFQLSILLYILVALLLSLVVIGMVLLPLIGIYSTVIIIVNALKVMSDKPYKYYGNIRFIK